MLLKMVDYYAMREAFDVQFKKTYQLIKDGETHLDNLAEGFHEADCVIWRMPTIDAVPVVRCENCTKSYTPVAVPHGEEKPVVTARFCSLTNRMKRDDGYCDEGTE